MIREETAPTAANTNTNNPGPLKLLKVLAGPFNQKHNRKIALLDKGKSVHYIFFQ